MPKRLISLKLTRIKKGTCLTKLQKYVIVNTYNELEKKKMMTEAKTILKIAKLLGVKYFGVYNLLYWYINVRIKELY